MLKKIIKRILIFLIPFLFGFNVYAKNTIIRYYYKVDGYEYVIIVNCDDDKKEIDNINYSVMSSDGNYYDPLRVYSANIEKGTGINDYSDLFHNAYYYADMSYEEIYDDFINDPEKYKPIIFLSNNKNDGFNNSPVLVSPFFDKDVYEETYDNDSYNLYDYDPEIILKLLNGELSPMKGANGDFSKSLIELNNINKGISITLERYTTDNVGSDENSSITGGTCEKYLTHLRMLNESVVGYSNKKGVCSAKSLNAMQSMGSIYDLKNNFDKNILEDECRDFVFGSNGYIETIIDASMYYYTSLYLDKSQYKLACLSMQSEYLLGYSVLTSYQPIVENTDKKGCELIGEDTLNFINELFDTIKIICLCVCIFLCILDVYKMVVTKESEVSKIKGVLMKRVIALIALFLVPLMVNIITDLINNRYIKNNPDKCSNIIRK